MRPTPLKEDFWKQIHARHRPTGGLTTSAEDAHRRDAQIANHVAIEVERTMRNNNKELENALLKEIAPTAVNILGNQYEKLISLSFDSDEVLRAEEEKRRKMREAIVNAALKKRRYP
ncbi:unnamed protein product [Toxocara canis]|nr:unnamed protein product [Toxocara canis]